MDTPAGTTTSLGPALGEAARDGLLEHDLAQRVTLPRLDPDAEPDVDGRHEVELIIEGSDVRLVATRLSIRIDDVHPPLRLASPQQP